MVPGLNTNVERNGAEFHVQTEDFGRKKPLIQSLVYLAGEVLTVLEASYEDFARSDEFDEAQIRRRLTAQHYRLVAEIEAGVFDVAAEPSEEAVAEEALSDRILEYLDNTVPFEAGAAAPQQIPAGMNGRVAADDSPAPRAPVEPVGEIEANVDEGTPLSAAGPERSQVRIIRPAPIAEASTSHDPGGERRLAVAVSHESDERRPIEVRQVVTVDCADEAEAAPDSQLAVSGVLKRLDERLEGRIHQPSSRRRVAIRIALALTAGAALLALGIVVGRMPRGGDARTAAGRIDSSAAEVPAPAPPQPPAPEPLAPNGSTTARDERPPPIDRPVRSQPEEITPPGPVASDAHAEVATTAAQPPDRAPGAEEITAIAPPPAEPGPVEPTKSEASLAPPVPRPLPDEPDPLQTLDSPSQNVAPPPAPPAPPAESRPSEPEVRRGDLVDIASVDIAPKPMQRGIPEYPKRARKKRIEGRVPLELLIDEKGNVARAKLADGVVDSDLTEAAIEAARAWRYTPALKGHQRVRVWKPVTVSFSLDPGNVYRVRVEE